MESFGERLRYYRRNANDPARGGPLTQERVVELLERTTGRRYSAAAVSLWERDKATIDKDDRELLTGLINIFLACGALSCADEADTWLWAGHYRGLDEAERSRLNLPQPLPHHRSVARPDVEVVGLSHMAIALLGLNTATTATPKAFADRFADLSGRLLRRMSWRQIRFLALWSLVVMAASRYGLSLLDWPHPTWRPALTAYVVSTFWLPAVIMALTAVQHRAPERDLTVGRRLVRWLLKLIGATIGFHVGYTLLFILALFQYHLALGTVGAAPRPVQLLAGAIPVVIAYVGAERLARVSRAMHGRYQLSREDVGLFLLFLPVGPTLALGFFHLGDVLLDPWRGPVIGLFSLALLALLKEAPWRDSPGRGAS